MESTESNWDKIIKTVQPGSSIDKIIGTIYGHALGDAIGLITEFKFKRDKPKIEFPYKEPIRGFPVCDWTDDTDHLILVMLSMIENEFKFNSLDIAKKLKDWVGTGFKELGDTVGQGLGGTMNMVLTHPKFLENPAQAANEIWYNSGKKLASNGSLMRTSIIGALPHPVMIEKWAAMLSSITHADPRCITSCVIQSLIVGNLIYRGAKLPSHVDIILMESVKIACKYITEDNTVVFEEMRHQPTPKAYLDTNFKNREDELSYWVQTAYTKNIGDLNLDEMVKIGYVFKCLACSIYTLQVIKMALTESKVPSFKKVIIKIASECGDADTNCAVAGATLGAYLGYSKLPQEWINALPNKDWLNNIIATFIEKFIELETSDCDSKNHDVPQQVHDHELADAPVVDLDQVD